MAVDVRAAVRYKRCGHGGGGVVELASVATPRRGAAKVGGLPARLRSALTARGWVQRPEPRVRFGPTLLPGASAVGPGERPLAASFVARAAAVREGLVAHLGHAERFDGRIEWFPPGTSVAWQAALHALDEVLAVSIAAATEADPHARRDWYGLAMDVVRDWGDRVPVGQPIAWSVPVLARRVLNLLALPALLTPELRQDAAGRRRLLVAVYDQADALAAALPRQPADPSLVAAARALFLAGRFFDGMEARAWLETGTATLWAQLREQVAEDGGHVSRSLGAHAAVLADYLAVLAVLRADNDDVPVWGRKRVKGMADFLARLTHPDGALAQFDGDAADGAWPVAELLATAAVVLHEPAFATADELPGLRPLLLVGERGRRAYRGMASGPAVPSGRALRRTGFYVLAGEPGDVMLVDGAARVTSGGTSVFGYELSVGGERLVVTPSAALEERGTMADYARALRARNVVVPASRLRAAEPPTTDTRWTVRDGVQYFFGTCDGVLPGIRFRRRIFCLPGRFWLVADEVSGEGTFAGDSLVHLHPATTVRAAAAGGRPLLAFARSAASTAAMLTAGVRQVTLMGGVVGPESQGWYATTRGQWDAAPAVALRVAGPLPLLVGYAFVPRGDRDGELVLEGNAFELHATLRLGPVVHRLTAVQDEVELHTHPA
jgi:heparinase II/III-like protein